MRILSESEPAIPILSSRMNQVEEKRERKDDNERRKKAKEGRIIYILYVCIQVDYRRAWQLAACFMHMRRLLTSV